MKEKENLDKIREKTSEYLERYGIKCLVIGISGGIDSALNCAILRPICVNLGVKLIGVSLPTDSNKIDEVNRANNIGRLFCDIFLEKNINEICESVNERFTNNVDRLLTFNDKIRYGNIKARMRMIALYNEAYKHNGIVVDNDNKTEHLLGFWTLNGDVGDITPMADLYKTEVYDLAEYLVGYELKTKEEKDALIACIKCVATDGLGITSSDLDQLGVPSYRTVDLILKNFVEEPSGDSFGTLIHELKYNSISYKDENEVREWVNVIVKRNQNSNFKRNHPYKIKL